MQLANGTVLRMENGSDPGHQRIASHGAWRPEFEAPASIGIRTRGAGLYAEVRHQLKRSGHPIPENDIWIAALARQHNSPLVTRHQHFDFLSPA